MGCSRRNKTWRRVEAGRRAEDGGRRAEYSFRIRLICFLLRRPPLRMFRLIVATLLYHWRGNLAVACGVAAGAAVLTGAL